MISALAIECVDCLRERVREAGDDKARVELSLRNLRLDNYPALLFPRTRLILKFAPLAAESFFPPLVFVVRVF